MTRIKQKLAERYVLTAFLEKVDLKIPIIGIDEIESPDFILKCPGKKIAVEHTRFIHPKNKQIEQFRKIVIDKAKELFEDKYSQPLRVFFSYSRRTMDIKENSESHYVNLLFKTVEEIFLNNKDRNFLISTKKNQKENLYFDRISVSNDLDRNLWQWIGAHLVEFAELGKLQDIINRKSNLIPNYQIETDERWLLIEGGKGYKSSSYRFDHLAEGQISKNSFNRIFLFDVGSEELFEI